jgi:hypothetical protein
MLGRDAYFIQMSRADQKGGRLGSRDYYWAKDLTIAPVATTIPSNPLLVMVDVDQYINMPSFLTQHTHPVVLYTFQPDAVSKIEKNYSYTFDQTNAVHYYVTGSGIFSHHVWNYSTDHIVTTQNFFGIPYRTSTYLVDRRATSPDHELIMLTPIGRWRGLASILYKWWIYGRTLQRLNIVDPLGFARLQVNTQQGIQISTGKAMSYVSAKIPVDIDDTLAIIARVSKYPLTNPQVLSFVDGKRELAAPLLEYHLSRQSARPDIVCPLPLAVRRYQFQPGNYNPTAKPSMVAFMTPLVNDAFAPDRCVNNEEEGIRDRVEAVKPLFLTMSNFHATTMREFLELLIPEEHKMDPVDYDTVVDRQARPSQRRVLEQAHWLNPKRIIESFLKTEAYSNVKPPRIISTINGVDKREYSRYMYAFEAVIKRQHWYAFSRTPLKIAERVVEILASAKEATNTDFSRFDGHGSSVMRELERMALLRAFRVQYHEELIDLHRSQHGQRAVATFGTWYETDYSRASGSPETGIFNSMVNAYVAFYALRSTKVKNSFIQKQSAWFGLGIYGGDDGITADIPAEAYKKAATSIGQELTVETIKRGQPGIKFLARIYSPHVWFGDLNSCCDIKRQLSKLHTTVCLPPSVTPTKKLLEKMRSFILSDQFTPIIGDLAHSVLCIYGQEIIADDETAQMRSWLSRFEKEFQYPNHSADWMMDHLQVSMPEFDFKRFTLWLGQANSLEYILTAPMFQEQTDAKSSVPVVVDDNVIPANVPILSSLPRGTANKREKKKEIKTDEEQKRLLAKIKQQKFAEMKAHRINQGTWEERPKLTFDELKAKKVAEGTWRERLRTPTALESKLHVKRPPVKPRASDEKTGPRSQQQKDEEDEVVYVDDGKTRLSDKPLTDKERRQITGPPAIHVPNPRADPKPLKLSATRTLWKKKS